MKGQTYRTSNLFFNLVSTERGIKKQIRRPISLSLHISLIATRRKIVEVILLNFRSNLGHKDKLEVI